MLTFPTPSKFWALIGILLVAAGSALQAQVGSASLSVTVADPTGAAIPNASVTLRSTTQELTRSATSGTAGECVIPALPPGSYQLTVKASGFAEQQTQTLQLSSGQAGSLHITMQVAGQTSQVTVESTAPILQTTSASVGSVVTSQQVTQLPLLGRSFLNAISLAPGTVPVAPAGSTTNHSPVGQSIMPSVFGQRQKRNEARGRRRFRGGHGAMLAPGGRRVNAELQYVRLSSLTAMWLQASRRVASQHV